MIGDPMPQPVFTAKAPKPFSNYSQGIEVEAGARLLFVSGQIGVDPAGNLGATERAQHELAWDNVLSILDSAGMTSAHIVDCSIYITNPDAVGLYREIRDLKLKGARPAATLLVVSGLADPRFVVEVAVVAARKPSL
jgi:2-iminobutanoate/2-iminopropanoate deaminase